MAVELAQNDILVFSDCRQTMKPHSVKELINNLNNPDVGTVVSVLEDPDERKKQSPFRKAINRLVWLDSQSSSGLNVYGALYAQRRSVFRKFPTDQLFDDLFVVVSTLSQGKRLIQEPKAVIYDLHFEKYYGGERLQRLARGLMLFATRQWRMMLKMNKLDLIRFLTFKYAKLLMPLSVIIWLVVFFHFVINQNNSLLTVITASLAFLLVLIPKTRQLILFFLKINIFFFWACFKFFFFKRRSVMWEKLRATNKI